MPRPDPGAYTASSQKRILAYLVDLVASALLLVPVAVATYVLGTPGAGAFEFGLVFFAYHAGFLCFKGGASIGKYIQNIAVVSLRGTRLQPTQALLRAAGLAMPWLLLGVDDALSADARWPHPAADVLVPAAWAWLLFDLLLIEHLRTRRSVTDHLAGTVVVNLPPPQPHRAPAAPMFSAADAEFGSPPRRPPSGSKHRARFPAAPSRARPPARHAS